MRLHTKLLTVLLLGCLTVLIISQFIQNRIQTGHLAALSTDSTKLIEDQQWASADNVHEAMSRAVAGSLERGEMLKFSRLLEEQKLVKGLLEFTLYSKDGQAMYSTLGSMKGKTLDPKIIRDLASSKTEIKRKTNDAFEIYAPEIIAADCIRCHTTWSLGAVGGVSAFRFSTQAMVNSQKQWIASMLSFSNLNLTMAIAAVLGIGITIALGSYIAIHHLVAKPMNQTIDRLTQDSENVSVAADQIAKGSEALAQGANEQAASLEETSASLEEMSSMTKRNAENADKAKELAQDTLKAAEQGVASVQTMNKAMMALQTSSSEVAKIIKTIDEIAFQTNILALNAAVEAARAGESGAGFAVVADEVRNLAQRATQAARETAGKIDVAVTSTKQGVQISAEVARSLETIVLKAREVDALSYEVATASRQQDQGIAQLNSAVNQMDKVTQSNAANAEESSGSAMHLNLQVMDLKDAVTALQHLVHGDNAKAIAAKTVTQDNSIRMISDSDIQRLLAEPVAPGKTKKR